MKWVPCTVFLSPDAFAYYWNCHLHNHKAAPSRTYSSLTATQHYGQVFVSFAEDSLNYLIMGKYVFLSFGLHIVLSELRSSFRRSCVLNV
jgi:hypothetical protein